MARESFRRCIFLAAVAMSTVLPSTSTASRHADTPPGTIRFRGRISLGAVDGEFARWRLTRAVIDERYPERSEVDAEIDVASLETGNRTRDRHLRSDDFLDVERFPVATVRLRDVRLDGGDAFTARIELELHGVTRAFPMRFTVTDRAARRIRGQVTFKRTDFGVGSQRGGLFRVYDAVDVEVHVVVPTGNAAAHTCSSGLETAGQP